MRRREFITLVGGLTAWPLAARAQQPAMPVVGFINAAAAQSYKQQLAAFLKGLEETGYVDGKNVMIEYRWAEEQNDRLPAMAADLVRRQVAVIAATSSPAALAAKAATTAIPIIFETGVDPIKMGLVNNLARPGGNVTGVTQSNVEMAPKRLQLLHELLPAARVIALLVNPALTLPSAEAVTGEVSTAASTLGLELQVLNVTSESDIKAAFVKAVQIGAGGMVVVSSALFVGQTENLAVLALQHAMPTIYQFHRFAAAGGLVSYGSEITEAYRLAGIYTGRVLKGDKPADLPVQQATKVELIINLRTAKALGITVPNTLIGRADKVIE
jgi:putative tryptophan/tyrosine transport system substrate-binding protein